MASLKNISLKYHDNIFTEDLSADFGDGFCTVFGECGSGKTTLCHIFGGLVRIEQGEVYVEGKEIADKKPKNRDISLISEQTPLRFKTVKENLAYPLKLRKKYNKNKFCYNEQIIQYLDFNLFDKKIIDLNDVEKAEVLFARAMIKNPKLILIDEPYDILNEHGVNRLIDLAKKSKLNVIWFTDDFEQAKRINELTVILRKGKAIYCGTIDDLLKRPTSSYTAALCGYNIIDGKAVLPTDFFKGKEKISASVKFIEKLDDGFYLHLKYKDLPIKVFSKIEMTGTIEVTYDVDNAIEL